MSPRFHPLLGPGLLLAILAAVAIPLRPLTPIDETRYISVAWEMWLRGDYLVMVKNGEPYSHKPPLLFWLYNLGWAITGVNEWWPRLVSPLFSFGSLVLTLSIAGRLWPDDDALRRNALWILASSLLWALFSTSGMFDVMLSFFALLGIRGLLIARTELLKGFAWFALAIGGGVLAKGPVILLHLLPAALLAPWWSPGLPWKRWYGGILLAFLGGAAIALAWAVPAAISGGEEYQRMIFWGQTANRMVDSFAHKRPFWWYLPLLPLLLFPWLFWPRLWRNLKGLRQMDEGLKLCAVWLLPTFVFFSLISGKQVHYLVPLFPAFALIAARLTAGSHTRQVPALAAIAATLFIAVQAGASGHLRQRYDIAPIAREIGRLQEQGFAVGNEGFYHAQYQFAGRLAKPVEQVDKAGIAAWFDKNPAGRLIYYTGKPGDAPAQFRQRYQNEYVLLLDREQARARGLIK